MVLAQIKKVKQNLKIPVLAYSIAINHYHLKVYLKNGVDISKIKQLIHGGVSYKYRKNYNLKYKEIWQSSRALIISSDEMDWKTTGYTIGNLLKHKEVSTFKELEDSPFSSYYYFKKIHGDKEARQLVYKVIDVDEDREGRINFKKLNKIYTPIPSTRSSTGL